MLISVEVFVFGRQKNSGKMNQRKGISKSLRERDS